MREGLLKDLLETCLLQLLFERTGEITVLYKGDRCVQEPGPDGLSRHPHLLGSLLGEAAAGLSAQSLRSGLRTPVIQKQRTLEC